MILFIYSDTALLRFDVLSVTAVSTLLHFSKTVSMHNVCLEYDPHKTYVFIFIFRYSLLNNVSVVSYNSNYFTAFLQNSFYAEYTSSKSTRPQIGLITPSSLSDREELIGTAQVNNFTIKFSIWEKVI